MEADVDGNAWLPHSRSSMMAVQEERKSGSGTQNPTQQSVFFEELTYAIGVHWRR